MTFRCANFGLGVALWVTKRGMVSVKCHLVNFEWKSLREKEEERKEKKRKKKERKRKEKDKMKGRGNREPREEAAAKEEEGEDLLRVSWSSGRVPGS